MWLMMKSLTQNIANSKNTIETTRILEYLASPPYTLRWEYIANSTVVVLFMDESLAIINECFFFCLENESSYSICEHVDNMFCRKLIDDDKNKLFFAFTLGGCYICVCLNIFKIRIIVQYRAYDNMYSVNGTVVNTVIYGNYDCRLS